jgi:hypothetical protein
MSLRADAKWRLNQLAELGTLGDTPTAVAEKAIHALADQHGIPKVTVDEAIELLPDVRPKRQIDIDSIVIPQHLML